MPTDFLSLFTLLNTSGARYVLVAAAVVSALTASGYRPMAPVDPGQFADAVIRAAWQSANRMQVFSLWDSTNQRPTVDILLQSPVGFEALWQEAELVRFRGVDRLRTILDKQS